MGSTDKGTASDRVRHELEVDYRRGAVRLVEGGGIDREHYASRAGISAWKARQEARDAFAEFARLLGHPRTIAESAAPALRAWFEAGIAARTLEVKGGKVNRQAGCRTAGLRLSAARNMPCITALFKEFDARIADLGYIPARVLGDLQQVRAALALDPPLTQDRLHVSSEAIARQLGFSRAQMLSPPITALIAEGSIRVRAEAERDPLVAIVMGRVYDLRPLAGAWPASFLAKVCVALAGARGSRLSLQPLFLQLKPFLTWIGNSRKDDCVAVRRQSQSGLPNAGNWGEAVHAYRQVLGSRPNAPTYLRSLNAALSLLSDAKVTPSVAPLRISRAAKQNARIGSRRRTVAEARPRSERSNPIDDYVTFASEMLGSGYQRLGVGQDPESTAFLAGMRTDLEGRQGPLPDDVGATVLGVLRRRLKLIQDDAAARVAAAKERLRLGKELLSRARIVPAAFLLEHAAAGSNHAKAALLEAWFPSNDPELSSANVLKLLADVRTPEERRATKRMIEALRRARSHWPWPIGDLASFLEPQPDTVAACLTLYLCASASNVSVGRTLPLDYGSPADARGHVKVTGVKAKAGGKPIIVELPERAVAVEAMAWLADAAQPMRAEAKRGEREMLFVARQQSGAVSAISGPRYLHRFKEAMSAIPGLSGTDGVPSMIRPSVILALTLENDGRLGPGIALGQHSEAVAQGYQQRWPTRAIYDQRISRFQDDLETLVTMNVEHAAAKLGLPDEVYQQRIVELGRTGLGTLCGRGAAGGEAVDGKCATLSCWDDCPHMVIVARDEDIAALQIWRGALRLAQADWERDRAERWRRYWLPWLCLTDVLQQKMSEAPLLQVWERAERLREGIETSLTFVPPRPF